MNSPTPLAAARYAGSRVHRVEDARLLTGHGSFVDDVVRPGMLHACFVRSRSPAPGWAASTPRPPSPSTASTPCSPPPTSTASVHELWYSLIGRASRTRRARRWRTARSASSAIPSHWSSPTAGTWPRTRPSWWRWTTSPSPRSSTTRSGGVRRARPRGLPAQHRRPPARGRPSRHRRRVRVGDAHVVTEVIHQQAYCAVPMETRGIVAEWSAGEMTIWSATQAPHEVRAVCSRVLGLDEHRMRVIMRDTGGGFGQKVVPQREEICVMLAAQRLPAAAEVDRGPSREPDVGRAGPPRARHGQHGLRRRRRDRRRPHRPRPGRRRLPDALAGGHLGRRRACCSPAPTASRWGRGAQRRCSRTHRAGPPTAAPGSSRRCPGRCCSTSRPGASGSTRSSCGAGTSSARPTCRTRTPWACRTTTCRPARCSRRPSTTLDYDGLPPRAGRGPHGRGPLPRRGHVQLRRADLDGHGVLRHRGRHDPHRAVRQGQRVPGRRFHREQPRDHGGAARRRRPRRRHRRRQHHPGRHRRHARSASAPAGAAAGR